MKVIYELSIIGDSYIDPAEKNKTGIYRVAYEILKHLYKRDIDFFYSNHGSVFSICTDHDINNFLTEEHYSIPSAIGRERFRFLPFRKEKLFKYIYKQFGITDYKRIIKKDKLSQIDLYHSIFYPTHPILKKYPNIKKVITIHDLIPLLFPDINSNGDILKAIIQDIETDGFAICVSENTKKDFLKHTKNMSEDRVFVSPIAASKDLFYPCTNTEKLSYVQQKYKLPQKYFLGLSTLEPRKNIIHVIRCFVNMIKENNITDLSLVLVGSKGWQYDEIFQEYENLADLKDKIIFTGRIPDEDLASIYSHALAFYYLSIYEGFGLPPLEAMQCGVPVVVSNTSSLPEVIGDAGVLLDPKDDISLCATMKELYENPELRAELRQKSIQRATLFSWEKTADQHVEIYKKIMNYKK
ncbi:glycosyltransferase family 1 protein [Elizabethkingia sp. JS20170427COW]|uniref:glycosyltransferase family 4 protein n=1 Tax=Elizabethkingia sp. JS20170427COW TaxID=2583851 RepID=UPI00111093E9|nr:glycosyltransferase family 1 protein [Elizabethkingia sp. JS20170427COW]QCX53341.1 glycosyltransferase family 4 protein [Elizabethkingia sp. JS20170427COW]